MPQSYTSKIQRTANAPLTAPDETEQTVAQAILDLENNVPELKSELRVLQISAAREVDVKGGKKAIIIFVPVPQLKAFHKIQQRFVLAVLSSGSLASCQLGRYPRRNGRAEGGRARMGIGVSEGWVAGAVGLRSHLDCALAALERGRLPHTSVNGRLVASKGVLGCCGLGNGRIVLRH